MCKRRTDKIKKVRSTVPAVEKALDLLELQTELLSGLTMNEIVDALSQAKGEIYRVVVYLTERCDLHRDAGSSRFCVTLKLFELLHRLDPTERLIHSAFPLPQRIAARTSQSRHRGVLNRASVLVLTSVQSPPARRIFGAHRVLVPSQSNQLRPRDLRLFAEGVQERRLARQPVNVRKALKERLPRIRQNGFEDTPSTMISVVRKLRVPVFYTRGVVAAVTSGFIGQVGTATTAEEFLPTIRIAAPELSQSLGFRPETSPHAAILIT